MRNLSFLSPVASLRSKEHPSAKELKNNSCIISSDTTKKFILLKYFPLKCHLLYERTIQFNWIQAVACYLSEQMDCEYELWHMVSAPVQP